MCRRWLPACLGLVVTLGGVVSCEGESNDEKPETPYVKFQADFAKAFCVALAPCCSVIEFDVETCKTYLGLFSALEATQANPELFTFYPDRAAQCLADIKTLGVCSGDAPPSCDLVTEGTLAPGSECGGSPECMVQSGQSGYCETDIDGEGGHCGYPATPIAQGGACTEDCPAGLEPCYGDVQHSACFPEMGLHCSSGTCQPFSAVGAACAGYDSCVEAGNCSGGVCVARVGVGAACIDTDSCVDGTYCAAGVCAPQFAAGAVCDEEGFSDQCLGGLCSYGHCMDLALETLCAFGGFE